MAIKVILEYYNNSKEDILNMINEEIKMDKIEEGCIPSENANVGDLKINVDVIVDVEKAKQTVNELLDSMKFKVQ